MGQTKDRIIHVRPKSDAGQPVPTILTLPLVIRERKNTSSSDELQRQMICQQLITFEIVMKDVINHK